MEFELQSHPPRAAGVAPNDTSADESGSFSLSPHPVIQDAPTTAGTDEAFELPRSYGTQALWLMPRDPQGMFAYWDIDWDLAFGADRPIDRKVYLRVIDADGVEEILTAVEPMAGSCLVAIAGGDSAYTAELRFRGATGEWNVVASSGETTLPSGTPANDLADGFASIPLHLGFQRMLDLLRMPKQDSGSLTAMLADLRTRAESQSPAEFTAGERHLLDAIDEAMQHATEPPAGSPPVDLWHDQRLESVFGFGNGTSPQSGFGGSSR